MKILQVNNFYGERSTGKLTKTLHEGILRSGNESLVVYGRGNTWSEPGVIRLCPEWYAKVNSLLARITGMPHGGCMLSTWRLFRLIRAEQPDVVHLQCINEHFVNIYWLIGWLKKHHIKTVLSLHAEFIYTANCGHAYACEKWKTGCHHCDRLYGATKSWLLDRTGESWKRMQKALSGFQQDCIIAPVSKWTEMRARQSGILKDFTYWTVMNGVDTNVMCCSEDRGVLRRELGIPENKAILNITHNFTTELDNIKGGYYVLELAKRMPEVTFLVAGRCEQGQELPGNLKLLGFVADQKQMAKYYSAVDLTLAVSKRETFSMPCAESLCCGTPVVGFKAGAPEQISLPEYSAFIEHGDLPGLEALVRQWLAKEDLDREAIAANAKQIYSVETMIREFTDVYRRLLWN